MVASLTRNLPTTLALLATLLVDKGYPKDGKRGVGWHAVPLRVRIISKHTSERRIPWSVYCQGKIAQTP